MNGVAAMIRSPRFARRDAELLRDGAGRRDQLLKVAGATIEQLLLVRLRIDELLHVTDELVERVAGQHHGSPPVGVHWYGQYTRLCIPSAALTRLRPPSGILLTTSRGRIIISECTWALTCPCA